MCHVARRKRFPGEVSWLMLTGGSLALEDGDFFWMNSTLLVDRK